MKKNSAAPFDGYLFSLKDGKDIAEGWSRAEADAVAWQNAYDLLKYETEESLRNLKLIAENANRKEQIMKAQSKSKARWNSFVWFLAGGALGAVIHNNR